jgi:hypothetical protein
MERVGTPPLYIQYNVHSRISRMLLANLQRSGDLLHIYTYHLCKTQDPDAKDKQPDLDHLSHIHPPNVGLAFSGALLLLRNVTSP